MEQLKKCPFCGSKILVTKGLGVVNVPYFFFKCQNHNCGAVVSFDNMTANTYPETAVLNWNSRKSSESDICKNCKDHERKEDEQDAK